MNITKNGEAIIKAYEGLGDGDPKTVLLEPYICPAHIYTVGWGHALTTPAGQPIDVDVFGAKAAALAHDAMLRKFGKLAITKDEAEALFLSDVAIFEKDVTKVGSASQNQFDAMTSFCFNVGGGNFAASAVYRLHVAGKRDIGSVSFPELEKAARNKVEPTTMAIAFARWSNANGKFSLGLFRRRLAELLVYSGWGAEKALQTTRSYGA